MLNANSSYNSSNQESWSAAMKDATKYIAATELAANVLEKVLRYDGEVYARLGFAIITDHVFTEREAIRLTPMIADALAEEDFSDLDKGRWADAH